jgi:hypothetical protein
MSDSILDQIRSNRKRAVVPSREDTLISPKLENEHIALPENTENEASKQTNDSNSILEKLKAELAKIPQTRRHSAVVLDAG